MRLWQMVFVGCLALLALAIRSDRARTEEAPQPVIEAVFVLDTTGSMGGLIQGAKEKVWSIANTLATGKPTPKIKMGLVGYRDRGDAYVTKVTPLTDDLDAVYADLMTFQAEGGGDGPESVNQALHEAVTKMAWSADNTVYRVIFLVGDFPPHMDYQDDVKYPDACKRAAEQGIMINTIQCGSNTATTPIWQEIATLAEGKFFTVEQSGGAQVIATPYDEELLKLSNELDGTRVVYGTIEEQQRGVRQSSNAAKIRVEASVASNAERVAFTSGASGPEGIKGKVDAFARAGSKDLLNDIVSGTVSLAKLDQKLLPANMVTMTPAEREKYIADLQAKRKALQAKIADLTAKRLKFQTDELAKQGADKERSSFDYKIREAMKEQAAVKHIVY